MKNLLLAATLSLTFTSINADIFNIDKSQTGKTIDLNVPITEANVITFTDPVVNVVKHSRAFKVEHMNRKDALSLLVTNKDNVSNSNLIVETESGDFYEINLIFVGDDGLVWTNNNATAKE